MSTAIPVNDQMTPRELLPFFYEQYNLGPDGGQSSSYVRVELARKIILYFPNFDARRKAVFKHDVHHIVTGYTSTFKGETEISAWEIGSGCRKYWAAFLLDLHGVMFGQWFNPAGVFRAFVKGRNTRNLYTNKFEDEEVMDMPVKAIRDSLLLSSYPAKTKATFSDVLLYILLIVAGVVYSILKLVFLPFVLFYTFYILITREKNQDTRTKIQKNREQIINPKTS